MHHVIEVHAYAHMQRRCPVECHFAETDTFSLKYRFTECSFTEGRFAKASFAEFRFVNFQYDALCFR